MLKLDEAGRPPGREKGGRFPHTGRPGPRAHLHALPTRDRDETSGEARQLEVEAGQR
jgi:hypothetical protein